MRLRLRGCRAVADRRFDMDPDHQAELEDRAADRVDRDWLLGLERTDWRQARADLEAADRAELEKRADRWEDIKARSKHPCDYGWHQGWDVS